MTKHERQKRIWGIQYEIQLLEIELKGKQAEYDAYEDAETQALKRDDGLTRWMKDTSRFEAMHIRSRVLGMDILRIIESIRQMKEEIKFLAKNGG